MGSSALWPMVREERDGFADLLDGLTSEQWEEPSLCAGWSVRDVVAHCLATADITPATFLAGMARNGFRFHRLSEQNIRRYGARGPAELIAATRATSARTNGPPGPPQTPLSEIVVHSEDVARPLGLVHRHSDRALVTTLAFYRTAQPLIGAKRRVAGLRLEATDVGWQHGSGPTVSGPAVSLLQAMSGRRAGLADLSGEGLATLTSRMP